MSARYKIMAAERMRLAMHLLTEAEQDNLMEPTKEDRQDLAKARALIMRVARRVDFRAHEDMDNGNA